jgi:hypothetical protein
VTWDSARTNSFFGRALPTILSQADDFRLSFDVRLLDLHAGIDPAKTNEFEIAVGLVQWASATNAKAFRGAGQNPTYGVRNVVEFDYFPDTGLGATFATTVISTNNRIYPVHNVPLTMTVGDTFHLALAYSASDQILRTQATRNGLPFGLPPDGALQDLALAGTVDFRVDTFAISSYSDAIQTGPPSLYGSILAHGIVDNVALELPSPPVRDLHLQPAPPGWQAVFIARTNWTYHLERSLDLQSWSVVATEADTLTTNGVLIDPRALASGFYRIRAEHP